MNESTVEHKKICLKLDITFTLKQQVLIVVESDIFISGVQK